MLGLASVSIFVVLRPVPSELIGQIEEIIKCIPRGKSERCQVRGKHCHNHYPVIMGKGPGFSS